MRSVELNVPQRCSGMIASATDIEESARAGAEGVKAALEGQTGKMVAFLRRDGEAYGLDYVVRDVNQICNREKKFPLEWIKKNGTDVGEEFIRYALPLIQGEVSRKMENGLPVYLYRKQN